MILNAVVQVDEDLLRLLLPYILHGVGSGSEGKGISSDYRGATYMILVQLSAVATLAPDFVEGCNWSLMCSCIRALQPSCKLMMFSMTNDFHSRLQWFIARQHCKILLWHSSSTWHNIDHFGAILTFSSWLVTPLRLDLLVQFGLKDISA